jgi:hypothetical protein
MHWCLLATGQRLVQPRQLLVLLLLVRVPFESPTLQYVVLNAACSREPTYLLPGHELGRACVIGCVIAANQLQRLGLLPSSKHTS